MAQTVGDFIVSRLHSWGVRRMFGYSGDGINGVFGALNRASDKIEFIQARHEEMAAFMASAYAKFSGELGVCIATSGPGAAHLVIGMYDARADHQPLLAIVVAGARRAWWALSAGSRSRGPVQGCCWGLRPSGFHACAGQTSYGSGCAHCLGKPHSDSTDPPQ